MRQISAAHRVPGWFWLLPLVVFAVGFALASPAVAQNLVPAPAPGNELHAVKVVHSPAPAQSGQAFTYQTPFFSSAGFDFREDQSEFSGCGEYGGKSGWLTFESRVRGTFVVGYLTTNFDGLLGAFKPENPNFARPSYDGLLQRNCSSGLNGPGLEGLRPPNSDRDLVPGVPVYIQTSGFCGNGPCANYDSPPAQSGNGRVTFTFEPYDFDRDGIADDPYDQCDGAQPAFVGGTKDVDANGCTDPDGDKDGVTEVLSRDQCPSHKGPASSKGCPRLAVVLRLGYLFVGRYRMTRFNVTAEKGARVRVSCKRRGRRCFRTRSYSVRTNKGRTRKLVRLFRRRPVKRGAEVRISATKQNELDRVRVLRFGRKQIKDSEACYLPDRRHTKGSKRRCRT